MKRPSERMTSRIKLRFERDSFASYCRDWHRVSRYPRSSILRKLLRNDISAERHIEHGNATHQQDGRTYYRRNLLATLIEGDVASVGGRSRRSRRCSSRRPRTAKFSPASSPAPFTLIPDGASPTVTSVASYGLRARWFGAVGTAKGIGNLVPAAFGLAPNNAAQVSRNPMGGWRIGSNSLVKTGARQPHACQVCCRPWGAKLGPSPYMGDPTRRSRPVEGCQAAAVAEP